MLLKAMKRFMSPCKTAIRLATVMLATESRATASVQSSLIKGNTKRRTMAKATAAAPLEMTLR